MTDSLRLDLQTAEFTEALQNAPLFTKFGTVDAEQVTEERVVSTVMKDGFVETVNTAQPGDFIVTNPDGEQYVLPAAKFLARYTMENGKWTAYGLIHAIQNPTGKPITITAPWGEDQHGAADCFIATTVDSAEQTDVTDDRYIIEYDAFQHTYKLV